MTDYYDIKTNTLFKVRGNAQPERLSYNNLIEVQEGPLGLRRRLGQANLNNNLVPTFFSTRDHSIHCTSDLDLNHQTNVDLVKVDCIIKVP